MVVTLNKLLLSLLVGFLVVSNCLAHASPQKLVVTNSNSWPPYSFINKNGEPDGLFTDIWRKIGEKNNLEIEFKLLDWKASLDAVRNGQADIHSGLFKNEEREKFLEYGPPLSIPMPTRLIVSDKLSVQNLEDIGNIPVGVVNKGYAEYFINKNFSKVNLKFFPNVEALFMAALNEEILAFVTEFPTAYSYFRKHEASGKFQILEILYEEQTAFAVKKGRSDLIKSILLWLGKVPRKEHTKIIEKWILSEYRIPRWMSWALAGILVAVIVGFVAFYIFLLRKSRRELEAKVIERTTELTKKNKELEVALSEVKTLSGILPICASCKKIRDEEGYWKQVEAYVAEHSTAKFSHGLCKPCAEKLYGDEEWFKKSKDSFEE